MKAKTEKPNPYAAIPIPVVPRLLLSTAKANYWGVVSMVYEPITGGVHVRRVSLERDEKGGTQRDGE